jgi:hypothetical protein
MGTGVRGVARLRARTKKSYYSPEKQSKMRAQAGLPGLTKHKKSQE